MDMVKTGIGAALMALASGAVGANPPEKFIFKGPRPWQYLSQIMNVSLCF
jgi:hypothetical protein